MSPESPLLHVQSCDDVKVAVGVCRLPHHAGREVGRRVFASFCGLGVWPGFAGMTLNLSRRRGGWGVGGGVWDLRPLFRRF